MKAALHSVESASATRRHHPELRADVGTGQWQIFKLKGTQVLFDKLELVTDGAVTDVTDEIGQVAWTSTTSGRASSSRACVQNLLRQQFVRAVQGGQLHRGIPRGRELTGDFYSRGEARLNFYHFPELEDPVAARQVRGDARVLRFSGGVTKFTVLMAPLNVKGKGSRSRPHRRLPRRGACSPSPTCRDQGRG